MSACWPRTMIEIDVDDAAFRDYLHTLGQRLSGDLTMVMVDIGGVLERGIRSRFETESDPNGRPWHPWMPSTEKSYPKPGTKSKHGPGNARVLDRYNDLLGSVSWSADSRSVTVGFGQLYAKHHEWGTKRMVRRGLLMGDPDAGKLGEEDERSVLEVLERWLSQAVDE